MQPDKSQQATATAFSFDETMKFEQHHCGQRQAAVAVLELRRQPV